MTYVLPPWNLLLYALAGGFMFRLGWEASGWALRIKRVTDLTINNYVDRKPGTVEETNGN
jgi:hypothetical protein